MKAKLLIQEALNGKSIPNIVEGRRNEGLEYMVSADGRDAFYTPAGDKAILQAFHWALSSGSATLDTLVSSKAGARAHGGDAAVEQYLEDPQASVFERVEIKVNYVGKVS